MNQRIIEYRVVQEDHIGNLSKEVNALMQEGWQPFGAPCAGIQNWNWGGHSGTEPVNYQAMVKYEGMGKPYHGDKPPLPRPNPNPTPRLPRGL